MYGTEVVIQSRFTGYGILANPFLPIDHEERQCCSRMSCQRFSHPSMVASVRGGWSRESQWWHFG